MEYPVQVLSSAPFEKLAIHLCSNLKEPKAAKRLALAFSFLRSLLFQEGRSLSIAHSSGHLPARLCALLASFSTALTMIHLMLGTFLGASLADVDRKSVV